MIQMVDLKKQYNHIKNELDAKILECIASTQFINGPAVAQFQEALEAYNQIKHVIPCANGTDALQIAMMALDLKPGDEVILPAFTYVATAEVMALLGLKPVLVDVDIDTFCINIDELEKAITSKTKLIVPVHLFGQSADMESIMRIANKHHLYVIEDNAQAIGADYTMNDGTILKTGALGHIGCTSFFPSKNLGCYGDGGAMMTNDDELAAKLRMIANHGQSKRYYHDYIGVNSRLDSLQAVVLNVKLKYLDSYNKSRQAVAQYYNEHLSHIKALITPKTAPFTTHVYHQYTLRVLDGSRAMLQEFLQKKGIPTMIYYPVPLYEQKAYSKYVPEGFFLPNTALLSDQVVSLPIHTEMDEPLLAYITNAVEEFYNR